MPIHCRKIVESMTLFADFAYGAIQDALISRGVWNDTLMVFSSDNGGQANLAFGGGNNYPLRGSKGSDWEGGIRAAAFVSGGFLPANIRGTVQEGVIHTADWYTTLCNLAFFGENPACTFDKTAAMAALPPIDRYKL